MISWSRLERFCRMARESPLTKREGVPHSRHLWLAVLAMDWQEKDATCNTQICSKPIRTCSRPLVDTGMGINAGHDPKLPPLATPKVGGEKNPTLQNHVKLMQNEEKHTPFKLCCWSTKTTPAINPQSWGWKNRLSKNVWNWYEMKRNTCPFSHFVDRQKLSSLSTPKVGVERNRPSKNMLNWCEMKRRVYS